jgi:hypothetical protein
MVVCSHHHEVPGVTRRLMIHERPVVAGDLLAVDEQPHRRSRRLLLFQVFAVVPVREDSRETACASCRGLLFEVSIDESRP